MNPAVVQRHLVLAALELLSDGAPLLPDRTFYQRVVTLERALRQRYRRWVQAPAGPPK